MFSMSRNILAMSEFTLGGRHIRFHEGRHMFYITLFLTSYCTLEGKQILLNSLEKMHHHHHSSLGSRFVPWLGEGISMPSPNYSVITFVFAMFILRPVRLLYRIVLVAYVVVLVVFLCIGVCHQQSGDWREIIRLYSRPCSPSLTF